MRRFRKDPKSKPLNENYHIGCAQLFGRHPIRLRILHSTCIDPNAAWVQLIYTVNGTPMDYRILSFSSSMASRTYMKVTHIGVDAGGRELPLALRADQS